MSQAERAAHSTGAEQGRAQAEELACTLGTPHPRNHQASLVLEK